jgi:hypothetical protein
MIAQKVATEEEMLPLFERAADMNLLLWRTLESSWLNRPLVLGCLISQVCVFLPCVFRNLIFCILSDPL